jgi:hypothetical protein
MQRDTSHERRFFPLKQSLAARQLALQLCMSEEHKIFRKSGVALALDSASFH